MDENKRLELFQRNDTIIEAVKAKAEKTCPGAVDLIAITGSFASGDYYEKSDLDLLIVINDRTGWNLAKCFILGDTAHDIYCHTWGKLEKMAEYPNPYVIKLINADLVYSSGEAAVQRYNQLKENLLEVLGRPLDRQDLEKVKGYLQSALAQFARVCLENDFSRCKYLSASIIYYIEYALYMLNKEYIRHGVQGIPEEICALKILPESFQRLYFTLIKADDLPTLRKSAGDLLKNMESLVAQLEETVCPKKEISADSLRGTYEEIFSNWKNKMHHAADTGDPYLSLMTAASCQNFYDELFQEYRMEHFSLTEGFQINDLGSTAASFDQVMEKFKGLYQNVSLPVCQYNTLEEFVRDYLDG